MTLGKFFLISFIQLVVFTCVKLYFFQSASFGSGWLTLIYWIVTGILAAALVRRMGVMNYLEAGVVSLTWLVLVLFLDYIITNRFLLAPIFGYGQVWVAYGIIVLTVFFFASLRNVGLVLAFTGVLILLLFLDAVSGSQLVITDFSYQTRIWVGYGVMILSVIAFHKKRHLAIRRGEYQDPRHR